MKNIVLFDSPTTKINLLPLSYTRPLCDLRVGITTIREKWEALLPGVYSVLTDDYLSEKFKAELTGDNLFIAGNVLPDSDLVKAVDELRAGEALSGENGLIALRGTVEQFKNGVSAQTYAGKVAEVKFLYDIFLLNDNAVRDDFKRLTSGKVSAPVDQSNTVIGDPSMIFIAPSATVQGAMLNTTKGPVFID